MMRWLVGAIALLAAALGLFRLAGAQAGLIVARTQVAGTPVTVFTQDRGPAPVVVIAHGFAGSQQLMQPYAITLARSGYVAVTYDLLGHGRNPAPLTGDVTTVEGATATLLAELGRVADFARSLPGVDGRLALLGHSMATDIIVRYAATHSEVAVTVAVSMFSPAVTDSVPKNLLVIVGEFEPALRAEALRTLALAAGDGAREGETYGNPAEGTARRVAFSSNVEHIGVLYSGEGLAEARDWLNLAYGRIGSGPADERGLSLLLFFTGIVVIARLASGLLPRAAARPAGFGPGWRRLIPLGLAPAVITPLLLWKAPTDFLPVPVGDYLAVHFLVYGLLTAAGLLAYRRPAGALPSGLHWGRGAAGVVAATSFCLVAIYLPLDLFVTSFAPTALRLPLVVAMLAGLLPYFVADEWLTRGADAPRGAYFFTKLCFLLSLAMAVAINLEKLFFLLIIVPVIVVFFVIFGLISAWIYRRTGHPAVAAVTNAILFAWAISVTFPVLEHFR